MLASISCCLRAHVRAALVSVVLVVLAGCSGTEASTSQNRDARPPGDVQVDAVEVVRGVPSRGRDPAVVAIDVNGEGLCTGVLIAPQVVLTARHCVSKTSETIACPTSERQVEWDRSPTTLRVFVGDEVSSARLAARGDELVVPPVQKVCEADIAAILLDRPIDGVDPLVVRERAVAKGDRVRAVGFGRSGDGESGGVKLYREHVRVLESSAAEFLIGEATCQGDSGGPALDEDTGAVVGVVSRGGPACEGADVHNVYTRVDVFRALIDEALARVNARKPPPPVDGGAPSKTKGDAGVKKPAPKPKKPASDLGAGCAKASDCAAGVCVTDGDRQYCSRACGNGDRCPTGFRCKASKVTDGGSTSVCLQR